jgi:hypothetical protein
LLSQPVVGVRGSVPKEHETRELDQ